VLIEPARTFYLPALAVAAVDQASKHLVSALIPEQVSIRIFRFLHLTHIRNRGICFGFLGDRDFMPVLVAVSVAALAYIVYAVHRRKARSRLAGFGFGLVAGGILGNLFDRVRFGAVVDFIDMRVWPVFNIADSCIVCGVFLLILLQTGRRDNVPGVSEDR